MSFLLNLQIFILDLCGIPRLITIWSKVSFGLASKKKKLFTYAITNNLRCFYFWNVLSIEWPYIIMNGSDIRNSKQNMFEITL